MTEIDGTVEGKQVRANGTTIHCQQTDQQAEQDERHGGLSSRERATTRTFSTSGQK